MEFKKIQLNGFKSFAEKTNFLIEEGLTGIVGPNGCGKSNIVESLRWVMGETSAKSMRGSGMEDVIFSGSDKKGKLGMAEVSLYLNNEDGQAPIEYSQVVLTRRLFRNGDSEYLLNGSKVRLSDIQMLLAKSKFGQDNEIKVLIDRENGNIGIFS